MQIEVRDTYLNLKLLGHKSIQIGLSSAQPKAGTKDKNVSQKIMGKPITNKMQQTNQLMDRRNDEQ